MANDRFSINHPILSIIVPCFNEEAALPFFYQEVVKVINNLSISYEIILINDGSKDSTLNIMKELASQDTNLKYLSFSRNFGKEAAMYAGFCNSNGDYVAVMDADMQDPPALLGEMLSILESGDYDSIATRRSDRQGEAKLRSFFARCFYKIINKISDVDMVDGARDFRLMKRDMVDAIVAMSESNRFSKGIFGWIGFRTYWLPYENIERVAGETKWSFWKLFKYAIDGIINFSQTPLNLSSAFGMLMTICSFILLIFIIIRRIIFGDSVQGWASTICIMLFLGGLQMFCNGIMGQYIARIYIEAKNRPHYIISESNSENVVKIK